MNYVIETTVTGTLNLLCSIRRRQKIKCDGTTWVWYSALGHQLSQKYTERPDVRLDGEAAVQSSFRSCPLDWEFSSCKEEIESQAA